LTYLNVAAIAEKFFHRGLEELKWSATAFSKLNNRSLLYGHGYGPLPEDRVGYLHGPIHRIQVIQQHPCFFRQHLLSTLPGEA
jgi:hypothetical protein